MKKSTRENSKWIPVVAMMIASVCVGVVYMWSAYKATAEAYYSWTTASANMVYSIMLFAYTAGSFIGGMLQDTVGPKRTSQLGSIVFFAGMLSSSFIPRGASITVFYFTYSVIGGFGSGFVFASTISGIPKWFPGQRGLGTGLGALAFAASTVIFSPVCSAMLDRFSMPLTLRVFAVTTFVVLMIACLFIRLPDKEFLRANTPKPGTEVNRQRANLTLKEAMKKKGFWILFLCLFFYNGTWNMVTPLIKGLGIERGLSASVAVLCLSMTGAANAAGRICMSSLSDRIGRYTAMYILCGITAASSIGLTFLTGGGYMTTVLAAAFAYGGPAAVYPALCNDLFGPKYSGRNYGFLMLGLGLSSVVFNAVSNALVAASNSYLPSFIIGAGTAVLTLVLIMVIKNLTRKYQ